MPFRQAEETRGLVTVVLLRQTINFSDAHRGAQTSVDILFCEISYLIHKGKILFVLLPSVGLRDTRQVKATFRCGEAKHINSIIVDLTIRFKPPTYHRLAFLTFGDIQRGCVSFPMFCRLFRTFSNIDDDEIIRVIHGIP